MPNTEPFRRRVCASERLYGAFKRKIQDVYQPLFRVENAVFEGVSPTLFFIDYCKTPKAVFNVNYLFVLIFF